MDEIDAAAGPGEVRREHPSAPVLRIPEFRRLWVGDLAARLGYQLAEFLFPLAAVVKLHSSGFQAGLISACQFVPVVVISLLAGTVADRAETRSLVVASSAVRGGALGLMGAVYALWGLSFWVLLLAAVAVGAATVFYDVGFQSSIPRVISPSQLARGNGLLQATVSGTQMAGPTLAGLLLQRWGLPTAIGVTAAAFIGATAVFAALGTTRPGDRVGPGPDGRSALAGLRYTWSCRPVRDLCVQSGLFNLHEQAFLTAFLLFGVRSAHLTSGTVGLLIGVASVGALIGSVASARLSSLLHVGATVTTGMLTASAAYLAGPLLTPALPAQAVFGAAFLCNGLALGAYNVYAVSLRQSIPPPEYLGSVTASYRMVALGLVPVGALAGGTLADVMGPRQALLAIAISMSLSSILLLASPLKRIRRVEEAGYAI
jgi:MFS family permease